MKKAQTYQYAGTSVRHGKITWRFTNSKNRIYRLKHEGHTEIDLRKLPQPMVEEDAKLYLEQQGVRGAMQPVPGTFKENTATLARAAGPAPQLQAPIITIPDGYVCLVLRKADAAQMLANAS